MNFFNKMVTLIAFCFATISDAAPSHVRIKTVSAHGSGCPRGTAHIGVSPDRKVFTAIFDEFQAIIDPKDNGVSYSDRHKRCDLRVQVHVPQGWQFSVFENDLEGWYDLQPGMDLNLISKYHFQGNRKHKKTRRITTRSRPKSGEFSVVDKLGVTSYEWSACGGPRDLYISPEIRLSSRKKSSAGAAGIDAIEGQFKLVAHFGIKWRRCK